LEINVLLDFSYITNIFAECESIVESKPHYENCMIDICNVDDPEEFFCSALNAYATQCAQNNVILEWRNEVPECGKLATISVINRI
jgi:hypothetical protein